ncbi:hypothetical protein Bbelb_015500 [Branchiostoma belcheri]|nr:hypothetical protein Bbelb_015500 [Branchiostoma belcheri]
MRKDEETACTQPAPTPTYNTAVLVHIPAAYKGDTSNMYTQAVAALDRRSVWKDSVSPPAADLQRARQLPSLQLSEPTRRLPPGLRMKSSNCALLHRGIFGLTPSDYVPVQPILHAYCGTKWLLQARDSWGAWEMVTSGRDSQKSAVTRQNKSSEVTGNTTTHKRILDPLMAKLVTHFAPAPDMPWVTGQGAGISAEIKFKRLNIRPDSSVWPDHPSRTRKQTTCQSRSGVEARSPGVRTVLSQLAKRLSATENQAGDTYGKAHSRNGPSQAQRLVFELVSGTVRLSSLPLTAPLNSPALHADLNKGNLERVSELLCTLYHRTFVGAALPGSAPRPPASQGQTSCVLKISATGVKLLCFVVSTKQDLSCQGKDIFYRHKSTDPCFRVNRNRRRKGEEFIAATGFNWNETAVGMHR